MRTPSRREGTESGECKRVLSLQRPDFLGPRGRRDLHHGLFERGGKNEIGRGRGNSLESEKVSRATSVGLGQGSVPARGVFEKFDISSHGRNLTIRREVRDREQPKRQERVSVERCHHSGQSSG